MRELLWAYKQQIDDNVQFIRAMYKLGAVMGEDVAIVTERFNTYVTHTPFSWKKSYLFIYHRAAYGLRDSWFYDPNKVKEV